MLMVVILIKTDSIYFAAIDICIGKAKKIILISFAICTLIMPFEQVVYAVQFPSSIQKTNDVNLMGQGYLAQDALLKKTVTKKDKNNSMFHDAPASLSLSSPAVIQPEIMDNSQGGLVSNASSFHGAWDALVDPRTGNASFSLVAGSILYGGGQAKRELTLTYSGSSVAQGVDAFSLGPHWRFNVGTEHASAAEVAGHKTTDIVTGDGHRITMISDRNSRGKTIWRPLHYKLNDVIFSGTPGNWIISRATGVRECIVNGYALWEQTRDGRKLYFYYDHSGAGDTARQLTYLCGHRLTLQERQGVGNACADDGIWITYRGSAVTLHGHQNIVLHRGESGSISNIKAITLPPLSSEGLSSKVVSTIHFAYDDQGKRPWLLSRVSYPTGQSKTFLYNEQSSHPGAQTRGLPIGIHGAYLPVVTEVITSSAGTGGRAPSVLREWYCYGTVNHHGESHNYTGYQGRGSVIPGRDNLFDRSDDYTYSVSRDNGLTTTTTTYNKYHLPQLVEQRDNQQKTLLAQHAQEYIPLKGTTFAELPGNYSLPIGSHKTLYAVTEAGQDKTVVPARVMETTRYDSNGQVLWKQDAYGRITMTQYCPPEGNARCPTMDSHWPQLSKPEKVLMIPASHSPGGSRPFLALAATEYSDPEPAVMTVFDYMALPAHSEFFKRTSSHLKTETTIKTDTSEHFWQVKTKTVVTLPLAAVADLKPGDVLPELSQGKRSTRTTYRYNTQLHTITYGQLNRLSVVKYRSAQPVVKGSVLRLASVSGSAGVQEKITFNIYHDIDRQAQTRTTTMAVASDASVSRQTLNILKTAESFSAGSHNISLGTAVYSLSTGDKIAGHDILKEIQTRWQYDHWRRPVKKTVIPATGGRQQTTKWQYLFSSQENAVIETLPGGQQFKKVFNSLDQVVSTWHRFADQAMENPEGTTGWIPDTHTTYTAMGKPASSTVYHAGDPGTGCSRGQTIGLTTTYGYDTFNRLVWKKTPDGIVHVTVRNDPAMQLFNYRVSTSGKEEPGSLLTVTESNILGKPVAQYQLPLTPEAEKNNKTLYSPELRNRLHQLLKHLQPAATLQYLNTYGLLPLSGTVGLLAFVKATLTAHAWLTRTTWEYDGNGRKIKQVQGNGAVTRWVYQQGDLIATIAPDGRIIHDTFNVHGEKVSRCVQPVGGTVCHVLGTRGFDTLGNVLWQGDEYGRKLRYTRDNNARLLSMRTPATDEAPTGHVFTYEYNALGMVRASVDGRPYVTHRYDPETWQLVDTSDAISHLHYTYDKNTGAMIRITRSAPRKENGILPLAGIDYPASVQTLVQNRYLQLISVTDESGNKYTTMHDRLGHIQQTKVQLSIVVNTEKIAASPVSEILTATTYDHFSRPSTFTNGLGIQRLFSYDATGKLASTTDTLDGKTLLKLSYTYDADTGNILTLTRSEGHLAAVQRYGYDLQNNLISFQCRAVNTGMDNESRTVEKSLDLCPRDIDIKGSGLTRFPVITDQKYIFDQWNNIRQIIEGVVTDKGSIFKTMKYDYAVKGLDKHPDAYDPNRLLSYRSRWQGQVYSTVPAILTYDSSGRIVKDVDGNLLHYNAFGRQDRFINTETGETTTYTYDSTGHQIAKQPFDAGNRPLQSPFYMLYSDHTIVAKAQRDQGNRMHVSAELAGVAHSEDGVITRWYLHNYKGDALQSYSHQSRLLNNNVYSPYGMQYDRQNQLVGISGALKNELPWWQSHLPGFDGEVTDETTGYQFSGGGYRAYNPVYRQFMAKDSYSPFKKVNGYGFGDNNPVMNTDPTGHSPRWLGYAMGATGIGMSIVMGLLLPVAAAATGVAGGTIGGIALGATGTVTGTVAGSLQIAATWAPRNMPLQRVSNGFGIAEGIAAIALGAFNGIRGVTNIANSIVRATSVLLITSGITGAAAGTAGVAASGLGEAMAFDSRAAGKSGLQSAVKYLGYVSMGLMAVSIVSGLGAAITVRTGRSYPQKELINMEEIIAGKPSAALAEPRVKEYLGPPNVPEKNAYQFMSSEEFRAYKTQRVKLFGENVTEDVKTLEGNIEVIKLKNQHESYLRAIEVQKEISRAYEKWGVINDQNTIRDQYRYSYTDNGCNRLIANFDAFLGLTLPY